MHLLLIALIGIATTQPAILDQTDEEWTASGYTVIEEVSINPLDYGEPIGWGENCNGPTASIGCQGFFMPTENGEKWRIIILLMDKIVVLQEDETVRAIPLTCSPRGITFSRNGSYALANGRDVPFSDNSIDTLASGVIMLSGDWCKRSREIEYVNIDTGEVRLFEPALTSGWIGGYFINDNGSLFRWDNSENVLEYYDSNLNLISSNSGNIGDLGDYSHASDGSTFIYRNFRTIKAFNSACRLLWSMERENTPASSPAVSADGAFAYLSTPSGGGLECLNAHTGELLWSEMETGTVTPLTSIIGNGWAATSVNTGLLFGSDADSRESINYIRYPAETWSHGRPVAVAVNGTCLSLATSLPPTYRNYNLKKLIYTDEDGSIIWISSAFSIASSPLNVHAPNNNLERDLGTGTSGIQSDGNRFIYSDYEHVMIMRVEGGEQE